MTPCFKIWGSLANLEGQNFFCLKITFYLSAHASMLTLSLPNATVVELTVHCMSMGMTYRTH